ncbi:MAG: phosphatase PAP2 family protein [Bacteroidetes bacterium]|nr:phosphatase PAP2 family protein [Bacteroidota bacterium]
MQRIIWQNKWYAIPLVIWWLVASISILVKGNEQLFLDLNVFHDPVSDAVFSFITHLPEFWGHLFVIALGFSIKIKFGFAAGMSLALNGSITAFLKHHVFEEYIRPSLHFKEMTLNYVDGVELAQRFSFPSGHSSAAFALTLALTFMLANNKKWLGLLFFLLAFLIGYSRIHLCQHFPRDVLAGSGIGVFSTILMFSIIIPLFNMAKGNWPNKSLQSVLKKSFSR